MANAFAASVCDIEAVCKCGRLQVACSLPAVPRVVVKPDLREMDAQPAITTIYIETTNIVDVEGDCWLGVNNAFTSPEHPIPHTKLTHQPPCGATTTFDVLMANGQVLTIHVDANGHVNTGLTSSSSSSSSSSSGESGGRYQYQLHQMVAQNVEGWEFARAHNLLF